MKKYVITFGSLLLCFTLQAQIIMYVSPNGKDTNAGTLKKPFRTIQRAKEEVAKLNGDMHGDIVVYLRGGIYPITTTLEFNEKDGGSNGFKVIYRAYHEEQPILSGGEKVEGWQYHEQGIWKASANGLNSRQVYVNNQPTIRARTPNIGDYYRMTLWNVEEQEIYVANEYIGNWKSFDEVELVMQMSWTEQIYRLQTYGKTKAKEALYESNYAKLQLKAPESEMLFKHQRYPRKTSNKAFHFQNAYEFMDEAGEWYLDVHADTLYYLSEHGQNMNELEVVVPKVEKLLSVIGTLDQPIEHLVFEGISFRHTTWNAPTQQGYLPLQACMERRYSQDGAPIYIRGASSVSLQYAKNVTFTKCEFTLLGNIIALDLEKGVNNVSVVGNIFHQISGTSVALGQFSDSPEGVIWSNVEDERLVCHNNTIANNYIHHVGLDYLGSVGLTVGYSQNTLIEHNEICHAPYSGISVGWGWTHDRNVSKNNRIAYNDIHHISEILGDAGGIYTLSKQPNTTIYRNYIHDCEPSTWINQAPFTGIYLDQGSGGTKEQPLLIQENLVTAGGHTKYFMHMAGIALFSNNLLYTNRTARNAYLESVRKEVLEYAGLKKEYKYLKEKINSK